MKKHTLFIVAFLTISLSFAQTNYTNGFNAGYKKGFCQDQGIDCIEPIPPISPIPKIGESSGSYNDGYNRGFQTGLSARKSNSNERTRYKTAKSKFVDNIMYKAPTINNNYKVKIANEIVKKGIYYLITVEDYDKAIDEATKLLNMKVYYEDAYFIKSKAYFHKNELLNSYNYASKINSSNYKEWRVKVEKEFSKHIEKLMSYNNYDKVIYNCKNIWRQNNSSYYFTGLAYYLKKDYKKAKKYLKKVKKHKPAKLLIKSIKSKKYYTNPYSGQKQETKTINSTSNNKFLSEVQNLYQKKEFEKLIEKLKPIEEKIRQGTITDKKILFFTYSILADSHYNKNNLSETIKYTTQAIDNSSTNEIGSFYFLRGLSKSKIGDYYGANNDYDYLIENYKNINYNSNNLATLYNNKAYNFVLLKKYSKAKPLIEKALSIDKNVDYIWNTKGELEYNLGNYSACIKAMTKAIKLKPDSNAYYFRGLAEIKNGNKEKGCSDLSKAGEMGETKAYTEIQNLCN